MKKTKMTMNGSDKLISDYIKITLAIFLTIIMAITAL